MTDMTAPAATVRTAYRLGVIKALLVILALAQLVDVLSTNRALAAGDGRYEANPVMSFSMMHLGALWWLPKFAIAAFLVALVFRLKRATQREFLFSAIVGTAYLGILANNFLR
ncbi:MAG TPA: DUF5658 family protein [Aliidongia sp.]|nr:DUF5658 family protein [Aliidongia sp.]